MTTAQARAASRSDVTAQVLEQLEAAGGDRLLRVGRHTVAVGNLDKPLWPGARGRALTKRDLLRYLTEVAPYLLPHLRGRPVFVTRYPNGIEGKSFYQKSWEDPPPFVRTVAVWSRESGRAKSYLLVENLPTLLWLGQMAALELHVWFSRVSPGRDAARLGTRYAESESDLLRSRLNHPDFIVVDLDSYDYAGHEAPGAEPELNRRGFARVREVAREVRRVAESLGLAAFVKTSGRTGLHLYLPVVRRFTFDEVRAMAEAIGRHLQRELRDLVSLDWAVRRRRGKVFFDYNQNVRGKSLASVLSPRRHPHGTVSMPLSWDELERAYPTDFTIRTAPALLRERGDPWAGVLDAKRDLADVFPAAAAEGADPEAAG